MSIELFAANPQSVNVASFSKYLKAQMTLAGYIMRTRSSVCKLPMACLYLALYPLCHKAMRVETWYTS